MIAAVLAMLSRQAAAEAIVTRPYDGMTYIVRTETAPRSLTMHILLVDLRRPGISFAVTAASGKRETTRQSTPDFVRQQNAQAGINVAFFDPVAVPATANPEVFLAGLHVSAGQVVSPFDPQPAPGFVPNQSYAIVSYAPALNIDSQNRATIIHRNPARPGNDRPLEDVHLWNAISGSAQIITDGRITVPFYKDAAHPDGLLTPGGNANYGNANSWYNLLNARTAIGITRDGRTLVLFTVDRGTNSGMSVSEVARLLLEDYGCHQALSLDGGGSTSMALRDPETGEVRAVNKSSDANYAEGRPAGANLAVFARPRPHPAWAVSSAAAISILLALAIAATRREE
jgi:hypothetical protein